MDGLSILLKLYLTSQPAKVALFCTQSSICSITRRHINKSNFE